jgi:adenine deaminase
VGHYKLKVGLLRENDFADFVVVKDLESFEVLQTYVDGSLVADKGKSLINSIEYAAGRTVNNFSCSRKSPVDFIIKGMSSGEVLQSNWFKEDGSDERSIPVIEALDGQLITNKIVAKPEAAEDLLQSDIDNDILKIVVVNRYKDAPVAMAFIKNFGLKKGAIASSVAHDSHNIVAVGVDDESICRAVNLIIEKRGGVSCVGSSDIILPLPVAGLMSTEDGYEVARQYSAIDKAAKELGSTLSSPFMTLSFMALLVIPHLKLSDLGLFDGDSFQFVK